MDVIMTHGLDAHVSYYMQLIRSLTLTRSASWLSGTRIISGVCWSGSDDQSSFE